MNRFLNSLQTTIVISFLAFGIACSDDDPPLPDNVVTFGSASLGFDDEDTETSIKVSSSRAVDAAASIVIALTPAGVTYGEEFTTSPAAVSGKITLSIPQGSSEVSFNVIKANGIFLEGNETIDFTIESVSEPLVIGNTKDLKLTFSSIVSEGSELQLNGLIGGESGASAGNSVFVDLSSNVQTAVARDSWDLGFYSGDVFRVIVNNTNGASAIVVDETDLAQVDASDINVDDLAIGFAAGSFSAYDSINGDLNYTAIGEISATESENKVYVVNRAGGSATTQPADELVKIRIVRKDNGYTMQYAKLNETTFQSVDIPKNAAYNFSYFHFDNGAVSVEPPKDRWDFQWTWSIFYTNSGGENVPYAFSDLVFINHHNGVKADTVFTDDVSYEDFNETDIAATDLVSDRNVIGSGWRATTGTVGVRTDRFYVIEDSYGNVYKLKFVNFHASDGGTRGKPVIQYALVKKGS